MFDFGREITGDPIAATSREWLVTNGMGGYASGTVANLLTRRYHGLLVAALNPPLGRTVLLSKLEEMVTYDDQSYPLFTNRWNHAGAPFDPPGFQYLECFRLAGTTPIWTYACADARLEKRVWLAQGDNTTYIRYDLKQSTLPLTLAIKALVNYRDFHHNTHADGWAMQIEPLSGGLKVIAFDGAVPFYLFSDQATVTLQHDWYRDYFLLAEAARGLDATGDHLYAGHFQVTLQPGHSVTLVATTDPQASLDSTAAYAQRRAYEQTLLDQSALAPESAGIRQLILAADQFIVRRNMDNDEHGRSIIAGYPWFGDWGRDTMISLPGLTLTTGRANVAARILRTFAQVVDQGMLPNRFPDSGQAPEYNTVDATLWYFEAIRAYHAATQDETLLRDLYPVLQEIIRCHQRGTRYNIHLDPRDGLLSSGEAGVQLTWMDAKVGDWVVTPRTGKAVEINALWYNALCSMVAFARLLDQPAERYEALAEQTRTGFARFWNEAVGYCYDLIDGPENSPALRPNQLFAVSLAHSPLTLDQQKAVVDSCARHLLTSLGLRSLAPHHPQYTGRYQGGPYERDSAYHQGTVWAWLIGPFVEAHLRVYGDEKIAHRFLQPLLQHLVDAGIGSISEIAEGQPPHRPRGCIAQAWSVAELLRLWARLEK